MKLIIKYNGYLDDITKAYCLTIPKYAERAAQTTVMEVVEEKTAEFREVWDRIGNKVIKAIEEKSKRNFPYSIVHVHLVKVIHRTQAESMIFPYNTTADEFASYLIHELCHLSGYTHTPDFAEKYKNENISVRQHIIINAMIEYIFRDILTRVDYLEKEKSRGQKHSNDTYTNAWKIVEEEGYKHILDTYIK